MATLSQHARLVGALIEAAPIEVLSGLSFDALSDGSLVVNARWKEDGLVLRAHATVGPRDASRLAPEFLARKAFDRIAAEAMEAVG